MDNPSLVLDLRRTKGRLWDQPASSSVDESVFLRYRTGGMAGLREIDGKFGVVVHDRKANRVVLLRDWIGEIPLHYYLTDDQIVVANFVSDIKERLGERFKYEYVRAAPHSHAIEFDGGEAFEYQSHRRNKWRLLERELFYDFSEEVRRAWTDFAGEDVNAAAAAIRTELERSIRSRLAAYPTGRRHAVLLSGGMDSFTVAYFLRQAHPEVVAFTLCVGEGGQDSQRACEIARHLNIPIEVVRVDPADIAKNYDEAIQECELYHLPNVYCAVGMRTLARALARRDIASAFCGEGVNEAVGDYHDWVVNDPHTGEGRLLQKVDDHSLAQPSGRVAYLWGCPNHEGRVNRQLGSGLSKHGIGRMVKPMLWQGVELECPYLDRRLLRVMAAIPADVLQAIGDKPGLVARIMGPEMASESFPRQFVLDSHKVRLQDASEGGKGGITPTLLAAGLDQEETLRRYNRLFGAALVPVLDAARLSQCGTL